MNAIARTRLVLGGAGFALAAVAAQPSAAQTESPFHRIAAAPASVHGSVGKFATPDGVHGFTFERASLDLALLRFDGDEEVLALSPAAGPRGDELYKLDTGRVVLRVTSLGGVIVFPPKAPKGLPAELVGPGEPLSLPGPRQRLAQDLEALAARAGADLGRTVRVETPIAEGAATGLVRDAAERAIAGLAAARTSSVTRVIILIGPRPGAEMRADGALQVYVAPQLGFAGRPSSAMVSHVFTSAAAPPR